MVSRAQIQQAVTNFCRQIPPALSTAGRTAAQWGSRAVVVIRQGAAAASRIAVTAGHVALQTAGRVRDLALPLIRRTVTVCREHRLPTAVIATGGAVIFACARRAMSACCRQRAGDGAEEPARGSRAPQRGYRGGSVSSED